MSDKFKSGKDYLKTKEGEAKNLNNNRGGWDKFMGNNKKSGMDLLQDEAWKENTQFDKKKRSQKDSDQLFIVFVFLILIFLFYLFK